MVLKQLLSLQIIDNEWRAYEANWDVEVVGGVITIRDNAKHISLRLAAAPPDGVIIEDLDMLIKGYRLRGNLNQLIVGFPGGGQSTLTNCLSDNSPIGIAFS